LSDHTTLARHSRWIEIRENMDRDVASYLPAKRVVGENGTTGGIYDKRGRK